MGNRFGRRSFLGTLGTAAVASTFGWPVSGNASDEGAEPTPRNDVPDTLDLAESAATAVNALTAIRDPQCNYMPYQVMYLYDNPPYLTHMHASEVLWSGDRMWGKQVETLLKMRLMSGSNQNVEDDQKSFEGMVSCMGQQGLYWTKASHLLADGSAVPKNDYAHFYCLARVMMALLAQYQLDQNLRWLQITQRAVDSLTSLAVSKQDYAYYPDIVMLRSGFSTTSEPVAGSMLQNPQGSSDHIQITYGGIIRALCQFHQITGDEKSVELAGRLVQFLRQFRMWLPEGEPKAVVAVDHAHFKGHVHAHCWGLWGMLDYADVTNDSQLKWLVRDGYEYVRNFGVSQIGLCGEGCTLGDMTALAVRLSETGVGDYWNDVERYTRNHLAETQYLRADVIQKISESPSQPSVESDWKKNPSHQIKPWESSDEVIRRIIGSSAADAGHVTAAMLGGPLCCTYNASLGRYYAWKAIIDCHDRNAQVNLLLNRTSPWLDVDSYLPYEGKTIIRNKTSRSIAVRMPAWVDLHALSSTVNGKPATAVAAGRHLVFSGLDKGEVIAIQFPVVESTGIYRNGYDCVPLEDHTEVTTGGVWRGLGLAPAPSIPPEKLTARTLRLRGNTVVDIYPRDEGPAYPLYLRDHLKGTRTPMKKRGSYVASRVI